MSRFVISMLLLSMPIIVPAQDAPVTSESKPAKIFTSNEVIKARVEGPWRAIMRAKDKDKSWQGMFRYTGSDGQEVSIPIEITTRGLTRKRVCDFPPLRFDFDSEAAKDTAFRGAGNLKLVNHCKQSKKYEQFYIKEFLSYQIYNLLTDKSYRVQGLDLAYATDEDDNKPIERFGFLIEDPDDVAKRNGLEKLKTNYIQPGQLDSMETSRFMMFQYLIANLDWSVLSGFKDDCCHNARLIGAGEEAIPMYGIPYDLDSSGLVDASYASPPQGMPVRNVRQRLYRGFCVHNDTVVPALEEFRAKRTDLEALLENEERLDERQRNDALKFIAEFYETLATDADVTTELIDNCRG